MIKLCWCGKLVPAKAVADEFASWRESRGSLRGLSVAAFNDVLRAAGLGRCARGFLLSSPFFSFGMMRLEGDSERTETAWPERCLRLSRLFWGEN